MDIDEFQRLAHTTDEAKRSTVSLYGLAGEVGGLFSLFKKRTRDKLPNEKFREQLREELGDLLWYIASIASLHSLNLSEIAAANLEKAKALFDEGERPDFDSKFPEHERLPRSLRVEFRIDQKTGRSEMRVDGVRVGDTLSDNAFEEDYYRFHDIFHLSFMTFLGWSPVMRRNLKRKRKSDKQIDENEDGARAAITEEAISAVIFNVAEDTDFFREIRSIPFSLLRTVAALAGKFEVRKCTFQQWRQAIFHACQIYRELVAGSGGIVEVDLDEQRIEYLGPVKD